MSEVTQKAAAAEAQAAAPKIAVADPLPLQDPKKQVGYLQQCLSNNKKPIGFFLGAGCPLAIRVEGKPLIPDIAGITELVRSAMGSCPECGPLLKMVEDQFEKDERKNITVEDMLTHIRAMRAVAGNDVVRGLSAEKLDTLDTRICQLIHGVVDQSLPGLKTPYHHVASWVDAERRDDPVEIFTTNYDLLMEQAFEESRVPYYDGFTGVRKPFFDLRAMEEDTLPKRWARLWKLHGSINWYQAEGDSGGVFRATTTASDGARRVIHPSHLKYQESRRMPYLAMIDRLRAFLKKPTATLVLQGYSFRDEHINEAVVQGLQCNQKTIAFAFLFGNLDGYSQAISIASKRPNLNVLAKDGGVIGGQRFKWVKQTAESTASNPNDWIQWAIPEGEPDMRVAELMLGDFAVFGQLLRELVGGMHQSQETSNGK